MYVIRPIDTQILYPQAPELGNRQHTANQKPSIQQEQFAQLMQKEVEHKKETINKPREGQKTDNDVKKDHKQSKGQHKEKNKQVAKEKTKSKEKLKGPYAGSQFDIRI